MQLGDFGSSKMVSGVTTTQAGTPLHMAPEVLDAQEYDSSVDIWSLGSSMFECMTHESLFNVATMRSLVREVSRLLVENLPAIRGTRVPATRVPRARPTTRAPPPAPGGNESPRDAHLALLGK